jgi:hypothetical protein
LLLAGAATDAWLGIGGGCVHGGRQRASRPLPRTRRADGAKRVSSSSRPKSRSSPHGWLTASATALMRARHAARSRQAKLNRFEARKPSSRSSVRIEKAPVATFAVSVGRHRPTGLQSRRARSCASQPTLTYSASRTPSSASTVAAPLDTFEVASSNA